MAWTQWKGSIRGNEYGGRGRLPVPKSDYRKRAAYKQRDRLEGRPEVGYDVSRKWQDFSSYCWT